MTRRAIGIAAAILLVQLFFWIPTVIGSTLVPGNWSQYEPDFLLYIIMDILALVILGWKRGERDIREGNIPNFFLGFFVAGAATWAILTAIAFAFGDHVTASTSAAFRDPLVVYILAFVAPTEELLFREVLPRIFEPKPSKKNDDAKRVSWAAVVVSSAILFPAFHVWTYSATNALPSALLAALITAGLAGIVLALIYRYAGYGASTAAHGFYDLFVTGAVSGLAFTGLYLKPF